MPSRRVFFDHGQNGWHGALGNGTAQAHIAQTMLLATAQHAFKNIFRHYRSAVRTPLWCDKALCYQ